MKKLLLIFSLSLLTTFGFGQTYKTVKVDSLVSVSLPSIYTRKDTLGQTTFTSKATYGFIVVTRIPNGSNNAPLKKEKDLKKVFKNYVKDVQQVGAGTIVNERDTTVGTLKGHLFSLKNDDNAGTVQYRKFLFLYTQDASYSFQYFYNDLQSELINGDVKALYSSIKLAPDLQRNDQYLSTDNKSMYGASQIAIYGGGLLIILIIVFLTIRRRRRRLAADND